MKTDAVYKRAFNAALTYVSTLEDAVAIPSEAALAERIAVSRTTVRKVLRELESRGIAGPAGRNFVVLRRPVPDDRFPGAETVGAAEHVEQKLMDWMMRGGVTPGTHINSLELARRFGVSTTGIREVLNRFSRYGLIERRPNAQWLFKGFTRAFALELFTVRELFEQKSASVFVTLPDTHPAWARLADLKARHVALLKEIETRYRDFSALDAELHQLINDAADNRFIRDFYDIIALVFHYHYQWNKAAEKQRNHAAVVEHLAYIEALTSRDPVQVEAACRRHLTSARETLLASLMEA